MGDRIEGDVGDSGRQVAIGKNLSQTTVYSDTTSWREFVRRDLESLERRVMILLWAALILFIAGAVAIGATIRQFDIHWQHIERIERRQIERLYYPPGVPYP